MFSDINDKKDQMHTFLASNKLRCNLSGSVTLCDFLLCLSVPSHNKMCFTDSKRRNESDKFLPVLYKQRRPPSEHSELASTAVSKTPVVSIVGVNVSMCVSVGE